MHSNLIGGKERGGEMVQNLNPANPSDVVGEYARATPEDVDAAIEAARLALPMWVGLPAVERADILDRIGATILQRAEDLAVLLSREEGKLLSEARGEVLRAGRTFRYFAAQILEPVGSVFEGMTPGTVAHTREHPVGVVGVITPWNFPIAIPAWKIAPALAFGNTVVFKPADIVPGSAWALVRIAHECGLPDGVLNLVMGRGSVVGQRLVESELVDALTFTGSTQVGQGLALSGATSMKRIQLEMGGKNPLLVLDNADLDLAVSAALDGAFGSTGQRCTASSRLIVQSGVHDEFVERLVRSMQKLHIGDPLDAQTRMGPVVSASQQSQVLQAIARGSDEGAELAYGGRAIETPSGGYFLEPTLFTGGTTEMWLNQEEIFGPVASVIKVDNLDAALAVGNDTKYGLAAAIMTSSLQAAQRFEREIRAGIIGINRSTAATDLHLPFGGLQSSSFGPREQGKSARAFFTTSVTVYTAGALQ